MRNRFSLLTSVLLSVIVLSLTYAAYWLLGFERYFLFKQSLVLAPLIGTALLVYILARGCSEDSARENLRQAGTKIGVRKALVLAFSLLLVGGFFADVVGWLVPANEIDHGPCYRFVYESCGTEDLNASRRFDVQELIFRALALAFLIIPAGLFVPSIYRWFSRND